MVIFMIFQVFSVPTPALVKKVHPPLRVPKNLNHALKTIQNICMQKTKNIDPPSPYTRNNKRKLAKAID